MDPKSVILYMIGRYGPMSSRRIRYLAYLVDRELYRRGRSTLFRWKVYKYGPISRELYKAVDDLYDEDKVERKVTDYDILYECVNGCNVEVPMEVKEVVDYVVGMAQRMSDYELVNYVYELDGFDRKIPGGSLFG